MRRVWTYLFTFDERTESMPVILRVRQMQLLLSMKNVNEMKFIFFTSIQIEASDILIDITRIILATVFK